MMDRKKGHYLGTEVNGKWFRRYRENAFLARGIGEYWLAEEGFYFRRYLTERPIVIPYRKIIALKRGKWHAGRWAWGRGILKIVWEEKGQRLSSGFILAGEEEVARRLQEEFLGPARTEKTGREDS